MSEADDQPLKSETSSGKSAEPMPSAKTDPAPDKSRASASKTNRGTLLILLNLLGVTIFLFLAVFVVKWPQITNNNAQQVAQLASQDYAAEFWQSEAGQRAEAADIAAEQLRTLAITYYVFGIPVLLLLIANCWYLFVYRRQLGKARRVLTDF